MPSGKQPSWRHDRRKTAERGYGARWQRERKEFLRQPENVLCVMCWAEGNAKAATVVDHKVPHRGDEELMWDRTNWQPLCKAHHDGDKQAMERSGKVRPTIGADGWPVQR